MEVLIVQQEGIRVQTPWLQPPYSDESNTSIKAQWQASDFHHLEVSSLVCSQHASGCLDRLADFKTEKVQNNTIGPISEQQQ